MDLVTTNDWYQGNFMLDLLYLAFDRRILSLLCTTVENTKQGTYIYGIS